MSLDLVIVDDDTSFLKTICGLAKELGFNAIGFELPSEALAYLKTRDTAPFGYLIDMKPYGYIPEDFSLEEYPESPIPERIFEFAKEKGWLNNFYFMTAELSPFDWNVIHRTQAEHITKAPGMDYMLRKIFVEHPGEK